MHSIKLLIFNSLSMIHAICMVQQLLRWHFPNLFAQLLEMLQHYTYTYNTMKTYHGLKIDFNCCCCCCFFSAYKQNQLFRPHTAAACMVSSPMKINVMFSGIVGMVKLAAINAHRVWHTIVKHVFACGLIKFQNVEMKVRNLIFKWFYSLRTQCLS